MNSTRWMLITVFSFCIMAIAIKEMSDAVDSFQIIFFRSVIGLVILLTFFKNRLLKPTLPVLKAHLFRNTFHLVGQYGWNIGIVYLSLAEVTAIEFSTPIWVLLIAFIFLKERLTVNKIISILLAFLGVLIIIKPGYEIFNPKTIIVLCSAISYAIAHTATKKLTHRYKPLDIVFMMCLIQIPLSFFLSLNNLNIPSFKDILLLIIVGISAIIAHFTMAKAMTKEDISTIISIDYLRLPILICIGILFYHENFEPIYLIGGTLIFLGNWINKRGLTALKKG